jgi:hypothetical protein
VRWFARDAKQTHIITINTAHEKPAGVDWTGSGFFAMLCALLPVVFPAILIFAPVAQLDRVLVSETKGHRFDSCRARQKIQYNQIVM